MNNPYIEYYKHMHLVQHTYDTEKALWSRRLGSTSLIDQREARLKLEALEIRWHELCQQEGNCKKLTLNKDAIDTPTENLIKAFDEKPKRKRKKK